LREFLTKLAYFSARMLLITRGVEAERLEDVVRAFEQFFIDSGYIDASYTKVLEDVMQKEAEKILAHKEEILQLAADVKKLYDSMDTNFQFHVQPKTSHDAASSPVMAEQVHRVKDLRGVACPMNFVKAKLELASLKKGELLEIYLDEGEPIRNVPGSLRGEGHEIVSEEKKDGYYSVVVRKG